jgi:hypothetical protein
VFRARDAANGGKQGETMARSDPILEGLATTVDLDGSLRVAPMGPRVSPSGKKLLLRLFPDSQTYRNLKARGEGVFHVTDDVLLLAKAALGEAPIPPSRRSEHVHGYVLTDACRFMEFVIRSVDDSGERMQVKAEVIHAETLRDFWGFNRGKNAVLEAAILATRLHLLPLPEVASQFATLQLIVEKTGGPSEIEAFAFLQARLDKALKEKREGHDPS